MRYNHRHNLPDEKRRRALSSVSAKVQLLVAAIIRIKRENYIYKRGLLKQCCRMFTAGNSNRIAPELPQD